MEEITTCLNISIQNPIKNSIIAWEDAANTDFSLKLNQYIFYQSSLFNGVYFIIAN